MPCATSVLFWLQSPSPSPSPSSVSHQGQRRRRRPDKELWASSLSISLSPPNLGFLLLFLSQHFLLPRLILRDPEQTLFGLELPNILRWRIEDQRCSSCFVLSLTLLQPLQQRIIMMCFRCLREHQTSRSRELTGSSR